MTFGSSLGNKHRCGGYQVKEIDVAARFEAALTHLTANESPEYFFFQSVC
jgi:hypothetical protein